MKKENQRNFCIATCTLLAFLLWTVAIRFVDMQAIGPQESSVGFATINQFVHNLTGVHLSLYVLTDWLSLVPLGLAAGFALLGAAQWVGRKSIRKVDRSILVLGGFYIITIAVYLLFEIVAINYRPVLINGYLEASYPSSTTVLVMCVMPTAMMQLRERIGDPRLRRWILGSMGVFTALMVLGRLASGVHWVTDIVGGVLLSAGLVMLYRAAVDVSRLILP